MHNSLYIAILKYRDWNDGIVSWAVWWVPPLVATPIMYVCSVYSCLYCKLISFPEYKTLCWMCAGEPDGGSPTEGAADGWSSGLRYLQGCEEEWRAMLADS